MLLLGLAITSLLVDASRRFALLAIGAWALAEAIGFANTLLDETPFG